MKKRFFVFLGLRPFGKKSSSRGKLPGAVIGIALSVLPLCMVLILADSMIEGITARYMETLSGHIQIRPFRSKTFEDLEAAASLVSEDEEVVYASAERSGYGLVFSSEGRTGVTIRGVSPNWYSDDPGAQQYINLNEGEFDLSDNNSVILASQIAKNLGVGVGDQIKLLTTKPVPGRSFIPRISTFTIKGICSTGYQELDRLWVFVSLEKGCQILSEENSSSIIFTKVKEPFKTLFPVIYRIEDTLGYGWTGFTWYDVSASMYSSFQTTKSLLFFIMCLIVVVGVVNISSSLIIAVLEKKRDIAVLKALGASPSDITLWFVVTGLVTGILGVLLGMTLGISLSVNINELISGLEYILSFFQGILDFIKTGTFTTGAVDILSDAYYLEKIPVTLNWFELFGAGSLTIFLSVLASLIPAGRAAAIKPIEIIRKY